VYTTVARVQGEIKGTDANRTPAAEQQVMYYIRTVSRRIDTFGYNFEPRYYTKEITATPRNVNNNNGVLTLGDFLLEPISISSNGVTLTYGTDVLNYPNDGEYPIQQLRIANPRSGPIRSWYPYQNVANCNAYETVSITGFWGMREYYNTDGFIASEQTSPVMTDTQTSIITSGIWGVDAYGATPLFSPGNLIRIDNELMDITAADATTKSLTLRRGIRGSTAAAHTVGSVISLWYPEDDIANAATRQAALLYARRGAYQQVTTYPDGVSVSYPSDLLAEIRATIQRFTVI